MSQGINYLHSHSGIERNIKDLLNDKFHVLIDKEYKHLFDEYNDVRPYRYGNNQYYKVPTFLFFKMGGVFKNLDL